MAHARRKFNDLWANHRSEVGRKALRYYQVLFGIDAVDPLTFVVIPLLLSAIALLASWIPARRAARIDPTISLRSD